MWENLYKKPFQTWSTAVKIFRKHQNVPMETHRKRQILFHRFLVLGECTLFLTPSFFKEGELKLGKLGKLQKLTLSGGIEMWHWAKMG